MSYSIGPVPRKGTGLDSPLWIANWSTETWVRVIVTIVATFVLVVTYGG